MTDREQTRRIAERLVNPETTYDVEESEVMQLAQAYLDLLFERVHPRPSHDYHEIGF